MNDLTIIEKPELPIKWDYDESVEKVKQVVYKWKTLNSALMQELWVAREMLSSQYYRDGTKVPSWSQYCKEIELSKRVVNRWLARWFPKEKAKPVGYIKAPEGKFDVIVIDPPWPYGTEYDSETRRVASPYPELSFEELAKIILPSADDCVLWLWTTHKFIWDAKKLIDIWDFEYKLILTWDKQNLGMGSWLRCQVEFCLLGIKGKPEWNLINERDFISEARREHSRKPDGFYNMIRKLTPGRILDYFSREERDGIDSYGNETNKFQSEK